MEQIELITGLVSILLSLGTIVTVLVSIGQYKGRNDQMMAGYAESIAELQAGLKEHIRDDAEKENRLRDEFQTEASELRKDLAKSMTSLNDIKVLFSEFTGRMDATMGYIKSDVNYIKEKVDAKKE